jgi:hypothetical protein
VCLADYCDLFRCDIVAGIQTAESIATTVVSSNIVHGEVFSIQHVVIKFVSDLWQVGGFLWFPPSMKRIATYNWNMVESGVKHYKLNQTITILPVQLVELLY